MFLLSVYFFLLLDFLDQFIACLASSLSFVHTIFSCFLDLHGERGEKEGETDLALKVTHQPRKAGEPHVVERCVLQVKLQATVTLSW